MKRWASESAYHLVIGRYTKFCDLAKIEKVENGKLGSADAACNYLTWVSDHSRLKQGKVVNQEEIENTHGWENPLKEYVIFKAVAIFEQSFRNLLVFLIDDLKLNIQETLEIGNKITISIDDLNKFSNDKATKGFANLTWLTTI